MPKTMKNGKFDSIALPMRDNLIRALAALDTLRDADFEDEEALGRLAKETFLAGLGARGLAALSIPDEDFAHVRGSNAIILQDS